MQLRLTHRSGETSQPTIFYYVQCPPQTHQTIRKPTSQEELDLSYYQKCGFQPFQHPSLQLPKGLSAPDRPPPDVRNGSNFSKGSNFEIIKCEVSGQGMFVCLCIQYLEGADYGKMPRLKGISYSSPNPRSRGASGEIMAVNKTLGIIYHLLAEKCRKGKNYLHYYKINIGIKLCNNNIKYQIIHIQLILTFHFS